MNNLAAILSQNPVFAALSPQDQAQLVRLSISRNYDRDTWIVHYGETWPYLLWVESGLLTALKESPGGRSLMIATIKPGEIFWGTAFFNDDAPMPVALVARQPSRIRLWPRDRLLHIIRRNGQMSWELSRLLVERMQRASDMVEDLAFQPVAGRLAGLLVDRFGGLEGERVSRDLTLDEMAARIDSTREMVSRILHRFASEGMIEITRTEFTFTNPDALAQIAHRVTE